MDQIFRICSQHLRSDARIWLGVPAMGFGKPKRRDHGVQKLVSLHALVRALDGWIAL